MAFVLSGQRPESSTACCFRYAHRESRTARFGTLKIANWKCLKPCTWRCIWKVVLRQMEQRLGSSTLSLSRGMISMQPNHSVIGWGPKLKLIGLVLYPWTIIGQTPGLTMSSPPSDNVSLRQFVATNLTTSRAYQFPQPG